MITPIFLHRSIATRLPSGVPLIAMAITLSTLAGPGRADTGQWTPDSVNWSEGNIERYAVHMMLLRGDSNPYHSRILWFQGEDLSLNTLYGGEWGWTPGDDGCASYPSSHFVRLGVNPSGMNGFCGGHAMLGSDGRVLVAGGDDPNVQDYGEIRARIFKAGSDSTRGTWSPVPDMHYRRFYPTVTALRDGRGLVAAGLNHRQHRIFGGRWSGAAPASPGGDTLRRFAPVSNGSWDAPVYPADAGNGRPSPRYAHTAVQMENMNANPFKAQVYFGGRNSLDQPLQDTWFQTSISTANELLADPQYSWEQRLTTGGPPAERSDHSAIVALGNNMVVFGGLGAGSAVPGDAWRFSYQAPVYHWSKITASGDAPGPRFGHSAIYDATIDTTGALLQRMIVFGGTSAPDQTPTDSQVYELRFNPSNPDNATWYKMTQVNLSWGAPSPRYWHTMNADAAPRFRPATTDTAHAALMFGGRLNGSTCSDELWKLWIFKNQRVGWEKVTAGVPPSARARHSTVLDPHQSGYSARIYVYGGVTGAATPVTPADSYVYVLDPWGGQYPIWTKWSDLGISLSGQTSVLDLDQQVARTAEVFSPVGTTGTWQAHSSATLWEPFYPPVFLVPGGGNGKSRVINVGNDLHQTYKLDVPPADQPATESWTRLSNGYTGFRTQTGVQYLPGRIMLAGGQDLAYVATGITKTLDTSNLDNLWVPSGSMVARMNANLVLLPTGQVLAVGGNQYDVSDLPIRRPQMWDPATGVWSDTTTTTTRLAAQPRIRGNHSTAILLPDGRVLSAGGSDGQWPVGTDQHLADIFCPPYLFEDANTTLAARPAFSNPAKPESLGFGKVFTICVPDYAGITRVRLIRPAATTHAFDQNQRYVPLNFTTAGSPTRLLVTSPASPDSAPPGDYMLFIIGKGSYSDVPSIARWVRVGAAGLDSCDIVKPQAIGDLTAENDPDVCTLFHLSWTARADDEALAASGPAIQYNLKSSTSSINSVWAGGTTLSLVPGTLGTAQTTDVTVGFGQSRYFRIKTRDDNNNWSWGSNQIHLLGPPLNSICVGGGGMFAGGGGLPPGSRLQPAAAAASLQPVGATWSGENTLLNGVPAGTKVDDLLRLSPDTPAGSSTYLVRIREAAGHAARMDAARLLTVDHSSTVMTFMAAGRPVLGNRVAPLRATDGAGSNITALIDGSTADAFVGDSAAVITVELRADSSATPDPVVIEASGLGWSSSGILLQVPDGSSGWRTVDRVHPRLYFSDLAVDSVASSRVRLFLLGRHQVRFVGRVARSNERPTVQWGQLQRAQDSSSGDALSALSASDSALLILAGPDTLSLSFAAPPLAEGQVRECFLAVDAMPLASATTPASPLRGSVIASLPPRFVLWQNQPNPFNAATTIRFDLPVGAMVRLEIFDIQGRRVKVLADHFYPAGYQAVQWDRRTGAGGAVSPGVYLYRLIAGSLRAQKKMVLLP